MYFKFLNKRYFSIKLKPPKEKQLQHIPPDPKSTIGFRGNHKHGRRLYDQVYPTTKVPTAFIPRYPLDWRNAGRFILTSSLARIENKRIYRHPHSLDYQSSSHCGTICANVCCNSQYKCLCSMRSDDINKHVSNVDSILTSFKAPVDTKKPLFCVLNYVPKKNKFLSNKLLKDESTSHKYKLIKRDYKYPVFKDRDVVNTSVYDGLLPLRTSYQIFDIKSH